MTGGAYYNEFDPGAAAWLRELIQAGVRRVYFGPGATAMAAEEFEAAATMFAEASVEIVSMEMTE